MTEKSKENTKIGIALGITADEPERAIVEIHENKEPLAHVILNGLETENLIRELAKLREKLSEPVPIDLDTSKPVTFTNDPRWHASGDHGKDQEGILLSLRHPGMGWLSFLLPHNEARNLGKWLADHAKTQ